MRVLLLLFLLLLPLAARAQDAALVADTLLVTDDGRLVAEGHVREIRSLIDAHPHRIVLVGVGCRELAARLSACGDVVGIRFLDGGDGLMVETRRPDEFYARLPGLALSGGVSVREVYSEDDNLEAVFKYLVSK